MRKEHAMLVLALMAGCAGPYARPVDWRQTATDIGLTTAAGAATGLVGGAIAGDPLTGAAAGAGLGLLGSSFHKLFRYYWESYQPPDPVPVWYPSYALYTPYYIPAYPYYGGYYYPAYYYYYYAP
jgi:hypothetical protein